MITLTWSTELPHKEGWYLCVYPSHGRPYMDAIYVTFKDMELVHGDMPEWLGPNGTLWYGPIENPLDKKKT